MGHEELFNDIKNKLWSPVSPKCDINGFQVNIFNYLADGVYPNFLFLWLPLLEHRLQKEKLYCVYHASAKKINRTIVRRAFLPVWNFVKQA